MVKTKIYVSLLICFVALIFLMSCTDLTEYEMALTAGLHIISPTDFSEINTLSSIPGASAMYILPGNLFILSTEGLIYRFDSSTLEQKGKFTIGPPSSAAYSQMVFSTLKNSAYVIGTYGNIIELSIPDCTVIDEFNICESPIELLLAEGSSFLFVADGPSSKIHQVAIDGNIKKDNVFLYYAILSMASSQNPDSFAVGTTDGLNTVEVLGPASLRLNRLERDVGSFSAMEAVPNDTIFVGMRYSSVGIIDPFHHEVMPGLSFYNGEDVPGSSFSIAIGDEINRAYVLSYIGDNTSRLTSYNYRFTEEPLELDIPGYPIDLKVSGNGDIYVLTTE